MTKVTSPVGGNDTQGQSGKDGLDRPLAKRFYKTAAIVEKGDVFHIELDGRSVRTPARGALAVKWRDLAMSICAEWDAQGEWIDPQSMPHTQLANTAIDRVRLHMEEVRASILAFAGSDLLCYRAETPQALAGKQAEDWDPVLAWLKSEFDADFIIGSGVMPLSQAEGSIAKIDRHLETYDAFGLSALHVLTSLTGSLFLALSVAARQLSPEEAWSAAHIDEDWQIAQWGGDGEAEIRRARRFDEMKMATDFLLMAGE